VKENWKKKNVGRKILSLAIKMKARVAADEAARAIDT
jgi:hypothetical protein